MNITRSNFAENLQLIQEIITKSHFVAIDLEMSGIDISDQCIPSKIDSFQLRYQKIKAMVARNLPLQLGLCGLEVTSKKGKEQVVAYPFNFYIYPLAVGSHNSKRFGFHTGSMSFLAKNNFDFNKLFYDGVPYVCKEKGNIDRQKQLQQQIQRELQRLKQFDMPLIKAFVTVAMPTVNKWMASTEDTLEIDIHLIKQKAISLLKDTISSQYNFNFFEFTVHRTLLNKPVLRIKKLAEAKTGIQYSSMSFMVPNEPLLNEVMECLSRLKKPLIVHNGFLDLMHIYYRIFADLPKEWTSYLAGVHNIFPTIYDTKFLSRTSPVLYKVARQDTNLEKSYTEFKKTDCWLTPSCKKPLIRQHQFVLDSRFGEYDLTKQECHEAGFDALITGYNFCQGMALLECPPSGLIAHDFHGRMGLIRNRIPMSSLKVPVNLEYSTHDSYIVDGAEPFYLKSVLSIPGQEDEIRKQLEEKYGPLNLLWTNNQNTEFCVLFVSKANCIRFREDLGLQVDGISLTRIAGEKYLVLTREQEQLLTENYYKYVALN